MHTGFEAREKGGRERERRVIKRREVTTQVERITPKRKGEMPREERAGCPLRKGGMPIEKG